MANTAAVEPSRRSTRVKRPAPKAIESDDEPAPAKKPAAKKAKAPPAAKKAAKKSKKAPAPPVALPKESALVRILGHEHELLREVASYCAYRDVVALSLVDRGATALLTEVDDVWKNFLGGCDAWDGYDKIAGDQREMTERAYGVRRVCAALRSGACAECGHGAVYFNVMTCARTCMLCWACRDSGDHGTEGAAMSQLCSYSYAKDRYLITDKDLKGVPVLKVDDDSKAHGLMMSKMSVVRVADALKAAVAKHGSEDTLNAKKAVKRATAKLKHDAKVVEYNTALTAWRAQPDGTKSISDYPKYPKSPPSDTKWNFLARNQRCWDMMKVSERYGLWGCAPPAALTPTKRAKVYVVTDDDAAVAKHKFAKHGDVQGAWSNIFECVHDIIDSAGSGSVLVVDKLCDLRVMEPACSKEKESATARHCGFTVGDTPQVHTLSLDATLKIIGTPKGSIVSDHCALWVTSKVFLDLEGLRVRVEPKGDTPTTEDWSPCACFSGGHIRAVNCRFESGPHTRGFTMLAHSPMHFERCTVVNEATLGHAGPGACLHFDEVPEEPVVSFKHCTLLSDAVLMGLGAYFVQEEPQGVEARIEATKKRREFTRTNIIGPCNDEMFYGDY
jgi:hypothetical protein